MTPATEHGSSAAAPDFVELAPVPVPDLPPTGAEETVASLRGGWGPFSCSRVVQDLLCLPQLLSL